MIVDRTWIHAVIRGCLLISGTLPGLRDLVAQIPQEREVSEGNCEAFRLASHRMGIFDKFTNHVRSRMKRTIVVPVAPSLFLAVMISVIPGV